MVLVPYDLGFHAVVVFVLVFLVLFKFPTLLHIYSYLPNSHVGPN